MEEEEEGGGGDDDGMSEAPPEEDEDEGEEEDDDDSQRGRRRRRRRRAREGEEEGSQHGVGNPDDAPAPAAAAADGEKGEAGKVAVVRGAVPNDGCTLFVAGLSLKVKGVLVLGGRMGGCHDRMARWINPGMTQPPPNKNSNP